jgi:asparagine synthase (glutamine-hydrolysing)
MCGICGFLNFDGQRFTEADLKRMSDLLTHRGPDDSGYVIADFESGLEKKSSGTLGFAHKRLSIIDLTPRAHQPMSDDRGSLVILCNGEIYNYLELRSQLIDLGHCFSSDSDTETMLYAYKEWGEEFVKHLNGMFAFALWDRKKQLVLIGRDRIGIKPLYYSVAGMKFAFSSELKALLTLPYIERELNPVALCDYFETRYIPAPATIFKNIYKLEPGHFLRVTPHAITQHRYWSIPKFCESNNAVNASQTLSGLDTLLNVVISQHLVSDVPMGTFLSGGIDSSLVTALAQRHYRGKIKSFTIGFKDKEYDEAPYAAKVAKYLGTEHYEYYFDESELISIVEQLYETYDEPFGDASALPTLLLSKKASEIFKSGLSGDGGDELFHGYLWYEQIEKSRRLFQIPYFLRRIMFNHVITGISRLRSLSGLREKAFGRLISQKMAVYQDWEREALMKFRKGNYSVRLEQVFQNSTPCADSVRSGLAAVGFSTWLPDDFMTKVDRASMSVGLEIRVPLLDHRLVELAARIPFSLKKRGNKGKYIIREVLRKYVPSSLFDRRKKGFSVPLARWLSGKLKCLVYDMLSDNNVKRYDVLDCSFVRKQVAAFRKNPSREAVRIWLLLNLQMWCQRYYG